MAEPIVIGTVLLVSAFTFTFVLALSVPFAGTLVRYRASYNPRGLALEADPEDGPKPNSGPAKISYFGMMSRVYRIEGWAGLYKGLVPALITGLMVSILAVALVGEIKPTGSRHHIPGGSPLETLLYGVLFLLIGLPLNVLTYRVIVTPYRLSSFNPSLALRVLLTPTERSRPWTLYLTPGLLLTQVVQLTYTALIVSIPGRLLLGTSPDVLIDLKPWKIAVWVSVLVLSTIVLTPLEVISTRLFIQRNHGPGLGTSTQESEVSEYLADLYCDSEDVISLRSEEDPYTGMVDCVKRIVAEEGIRALYRGWWITALGALGRA